MGKCQTCGNQYTHSFDIIMGEMKYTFDSFECAIHLLAPQCQHCSCRVIGHGMESTSGIFCCAHCAQAAGISDVQDHSQHENKALPSFE